MVYLCHSFVKILPLVLKIGNSQANLQLKSLSIWRAVFYCVNPIYFVSIYSKHDLRPGVHLNSLGHVTNQIKSNQIKSIFVGIKSSHRTVTSHMYTITQLHVQLQSQIDHICINSLVPSAPKINTGNPGNQANYWGGLTPPLTHLATRTSSIGPLRSWEPANQCKYGQ